MLICGMILIVVAGGFFGYCMSEELAKREKNLRTFKNFILFLQNEITYKIRPVYEAVNKYCSQNNSDNKDDVVRVFEGVDLVEKEQIDVSKLYDLVRDHMNDLGFLEGDLSSIRDFFDNLGKSDLEGQKVLFDTTLTRLEECINEARAVRTQKSKMYRALGLGAGAVIALLII